jgi:hypothetical protein
VAGRVEGRGGGGVAGLLLELSEHLLAVQEILSRPELQWLTAYREKHKGCSEAYTWVENRAGSRYWYWYLKCPRRRPSSVYLGASPEAHRALMEAARAVARVQRALAGLNLGELAGQLAEAARRLERLEATAPAEEASREEPRQTGQHDTSTARKRGRRPPASTPSEPPQPPEEHGESNTQKTGAARTPRQHRTQKSNPTPP